MAILEQIDREVAVMEASHGKKPYAIGYDAGVQYRRTCASQPFPNPSATDSIEGKEWQDGFDTGWSDEHFRQENPTDL